MRAPQRTLARGCDVVTLEIEQVSIDSLEAAEEFAPVRPGRELMRMMQDRVLQKEWLRKQGFPLGEFRAVTSEAEMVEGVQGAGRAMLREERAWRLRRPQPGEAGRGR